MKDDEIYFFDPVELRPRPISADGYILDIGGGGEGIIGRLMGKVIVAELFTNGAEAPLALGHKTR